MRGYTMDKDDYLKRLRRVEGQVRGLQRVGIGLLEQHVNHCVVDAALNEDPEAAKAKVQEATRAIERLVRS